MRTEEQHGEQFFRQYQITIKDSGNERENLRRYLNECRRLVQQCFSEVTLSGVVVECLLGCESLVASPECAEQPVPYLEYPPTGLNTGSL